MILDNLDNENVRKYMKEEVDHDIEEDRLYRSTRLKEGYDDLYLQMLCAAIKKGDVKSFADNILSNNCLEEFETNPRSPSKLKKVPRNAHEVLAEGEFNRFYMRGLCRKAIDEGLTLEIYRAKEVKRPRSISLSLEGNEMDPKELLEDLRENGADNALGLPPGPSSGLSVKIKDD